MDKVPNKTIWIFSLLFLTLTTLGFAQETIHVKELQILISGGKTQEKTIKKWIQLKEGQNFLDWETLKKQIEEDKQELLNLRVFEEIETQVDLLGPLNGKQQVRVVYTIQDGWSFVPIPLVLYDTNEGIQFLYIQIWDNISGSLNNWFTLTSLSLKNSDGQWVVGPWKILPVLNNIKVGNQIIGFRLDQEYAEKKHYDNKILTSDYSYYRSAFAVETDFPFGNNNNWTYSISPGIETRYGYTTHLGSKTFHNPTLSLLLEHSLYFDNVDYIGNARSGLKIGMTHNLRWDIRENDTQLITDFQGEVAPYFTYKWFSYYARLSGIYVINDEYEDLGEPLRGIPNATMYGFAALYLNQTVGLDVWHWKGVWDLQIHLFYDAGFVVNSKKRQLDWSDFRQATGVDLLLFIDKVPNLSFRFSWGFDLDPEVSWEDSNKIEFIVRYSFSY